MCDRQGAVARQSHDREQRPSVPGGGLLSIHPGFTWMYKVFNLQFWQEFEEGLARIDHQRILILGQVLPPPPHCGFGQLVQSVGDNPLTIPP